MKTKTSGTLTALLTLASSAAVIVAGCGSDDLQGTPLTDRADGSASNGPDGATGTASGEAGGCVPGSAAVEPADPALYPSCCATGAARCVPSAKVPAGADKALAACAGGYCVPDPLIRSGGKKPPSCTSLGDAPGVCLSVCVPQVAMYKDLLPQATCAADERCAPCVSPLDMLPTGACAIGAAGDPGSGSGGTCTPAKPADAGAPPAPTNDGSTAAVCPHQGPPVIDPSALPSCDAAGGAHCLAAALVPPAMASRLATCATGLCVPDSFIAAGGQFIPPTCTSLGGLEGRCLHQSLPDVAAQKSTLPQATCAAYERCSPCFSPIDEKATGACSLSCDPGPKDSAPTCPHKGPPVIEPTTLPACGSVPGAHCMSASLLSPAMAAQLSACPTGLCVPDTFIAAGGQFIPATCTSLGGLEGRCLHQSLPAVASQGSTLPQSTCATNERCAPCYSPLDNKATGACGLSCDPGPKGAAPTCPHQGPPVIDPSTLPACGAFGGAHCMNASLLSPAMAAQLATCATGLCVPDTFIAAGGQFIPPTCNGIGGAEGRCLNRAIPQVASQANLLQSTCAANERCTPCFNPLDGTDTGACKLSCDPGAQRPKYVFDSCCRELGGSAGKCVPTPAVPVSERTNLVADTCSTQGDLCVPTENLQASFSPPACSAFAIVYFGNYHGVCLSDCLHFSGLQSLVVKQGNCDAQHLCVPCTSPTGAATGAPGCPP